MSENFNYCHIVGKTDVGRIRAVNEDGMCDAVTQNGLVSVVCDGMGGHVGGATASKIAVSTIIENLNNTYYDDPRIAIGESIDKANRAIIQKSMEQPELSGMGSTCVLLLVRDGKVYIGHVGDSRIYLVRSKKIVQLTKDHSYVQMLVDCGEITQEQAEHHPRKNEITNALGMPNMSPATVADDAIIPEAGDCFILCSDGLSGMVSDDKICKIISLQSEINAQERIDKLVSLANENGGVDNITVQLVEFSVSPSTAIITRTKFPIWAKIICVVFVSVAFGVGGYFLLPERQRPDESNNLQKTGSSSKCDTIPYCYGDIFFEKNAVIVELEFKESSLIFKRKGEQIYQINSSFNQNSLNVCTQLVDIKYNNSLLSFKDRTPGDSVVFYISQSDSARTYRCIFNIKSSTEKSSKDANNDKRPIVSEHIGSDITAKIDTVKIQFECDKLEKDTKLLLNYSSENPCLIMGRNEQRVFDSMLGEILINDLSYNDLYWEIRHNKDYKQLSFVLKKDLENSEVFLIPCIVKNTKGKVVISVKLVVKRHDATEGEFQVVV